MHNTLSVSPDNRNALKKAFLLAILIVGAFLRISNYQYCPTGHYSLPFMRFALDIVEGINYPLQGPRLGFLDAFHGPAAYYLIAIPVFFSRNPAVPYIFVGLVNVLAIYITYRIGRDFFSETAGLVAALILAIDPTILMFTKDVADKGLTMIFVVLVYYCFFNIISKRNARFTWLLLPAFITAGVQVHMQLNLILALAVLQFFLYKPTVNWKFLVAGCLLAIIPVFPQIYHDLSGERSHFLAFFQALLDYGNDHSSMPDSMVNRKGAFLLNYTTTFGVLFYLYVMSLVYIIGTRAAALKKGVGLSDKDKRIISLFIFTTISFMIFSRHLNQNLLRHFTSYTSLTLIIGVAVSEMLNQPLRIRSMSGKLLHGGYAAAAAILFAGILVLYSIKAYGLTLYYVRPVPTDFFDRFGKVMCTDIYFDSCNELLDKSLEAFSYTSYEYRRKQYDVLYGGFGMDAKTFIENVHGTKYYMLLGDDGYLFRTLKPKATVKDAGSYHYLMADRDALETLVGDVAYKKVEYTDNIGIMQYESFIDYSSITYSYFGEDVRNEDKSSHIWRDHDTSAADRPALDRIAAYQELHWTMEWNYPGIMFNGNIESPGDSPAVLFVVEVFFRDKVDQLAGPDRPLDINFFFNGAPLDYVAERYDGEMLFGESYKFYYMINESMFGGGDSFTLKANMSFPEDSFFFDFYSIPLKTDSVPDLLSENEQAQ